ncbi:lipid phosphate phosphatase 2-like isoform X2 [Apium graveolens]|uniref:lipid phosphate phosphatase 2-like isoform X2 n=1 Tax=Apium graveolens TaxID=4045 RepID=UPI003D7908DD
MGYSDLKQDLPCFSFVAALCIVPLDPFGFKQSPLLHFLSHTSGKVISFILQLARMPDIQLGAHTIRSHGTHMARLHMHDWLILMLLVVIEVGLNVIEPFHRFVGEGMMEDLKYPLQDNTVPLWAVPIIAILLPLAVIIIYYFIRKDVFDLHQAVLGLLFAVLVTAVLTDSIKDAVGRPRPDFFWRCFPNGKGVFDPTTKNVMCTGEKSVIREGHKSFPSGHTSWSFAGLGFLAWYLSGKVRVFDRRGHVAKLCIVFLPLLVAALVGVSRVDDYWHHWQDVFAGGVLGLTVASFCYLQFFPPPYDIDDCIKSKQIICTVSMISKQVVSETWNIHTSPMPSSGWGPHVYFQTLADSASGNGTQSSSSNINCLGVRPAELENVYIQSHNGVVSPMLNGVESGRRY